MAESRPVRKIPRAIRAGVTAITTIGAIALGVAAFSSFEYSPWTRDGRIRVYVVDTAPDVAGKVISVPVSDNQFVHKGDLLYAIDPRDYEVAVRRAQAALDASREKFALEHQQVLRRQRVAKGAVSAEEEQVYAINAHICEIEISAFEAALYKAKVDLERCRITSPVNGWVTNLTVRVGNYANAGERQMSIVDADSFWVAGYFEETRLRRIRVGAEARAVMIGYPHVELHGHVESIVRGINDMDTAPNSQGLPSVSPVFTWVRLAQRIPVRIHIDTIPDNFTLSAGETCTVYVDEQESH